MSAIFFCNLSICFCVTVVFLVLDNTLTANAHKILQNIVTGEDKYSFYFDLDGDYILSAMRTKDERMI